MNLKNLKDTYHLSRFCLRACEALNSNRDLMGIATETSNTSRQSWISVEKWTPSKWLRFFSRCCDVQQTCKSIQQRGWQWYHLNLYLHYVNIFVVVFLVLHDIITLTNSPFYVRWLHFLQWLFRLLIDQNITYSFFNNPAYWSQWIRCQIDLFPLFSDEKHMTHIFSFLEFLIITYCWCYSKTSCCCHQVGLGNCYGIFDDFCNPGVSEAINNIINLLMMHSMHGPPTSSWMTGGQVCGRGSAAIRTGGVGAPVLRGKDSCVWHVCMTYAWAHVSCHSIKRHHKGHRDLHPYRNLDFVANLSMAWHRKFPVARDLGHPVLEWDRVVVFHVIHGGISRAIFRQIRDHPTSPTLSLQQKMTWK